MKLLPGFAAVIVIATSFTVFAEDKLPVVKELRHGFYVSSVDLDGRIVKQYIVDTRAQLCFLSKELIPCENLAKRKEWREIIHWVNE